jgi:glycopeptide antibiotics resistance protein
MLIFFEAIHLYIAFVVIAIVLIGLWMRGRSLSYLFFCAIFGIYLIGVVSVIVFPIAPLSAEYAETFRTRFNFVPFYFGRCDDMPRLCLRGIIENILLTIPFGFGISFILRLKSKDFLWLALLVGIVFETIQLIISLVFRSPFRAVDINDVILNAIGVWLGYGFFRIFGWLYLYITQKFEINNKNEFGYIYDVVRQSANT